ncbi:MAG TPA: alpha/beta fold hydrolase [Polyangiales bacterium]|nr:alpha/beta fold hydrolase [Polyangiales bacterium]
MADALRHAFADVDGVRLHWAELGERPLAQRHSQRTPLVLIHGITDSHLTWRKAAEELARDRWVLMPDLPGCGLSGRPDASYELEWHSRIIASWLEQLGLASVDVVGHSYGGGVAQMLLLACPERIRRMVLAASGGLGREVGFWLKFATFPHFVERYGQPFMAFGTRRALGTWRDAGEHKDVEALSAMNAERGTARAFSRTVRDVIGFGGQTRHFLHRAHEVKLLPPIAVLWGERDTLIPIAHGKTFVGHVDGAQFASFPDCGHYLHQDRPLEFASSVRAFLDAAEATPVTLRATPLEPPALAAAVLKKLDAVARSLVPLRWLKRSRRSDDSGSRAA